jgi:signal transduction histidine kinase
MSSVLEQERPTQTILVVDDSPLSRRILSDQLTLHGFKVVCEDNGLDAIKSAFCLQPDGIFLDIHMPKVNGYQVCRLLKDNTATKHIPIVIVSAPDKSKDGIENPKNWSFETGADAYLEKSADLDVFPLMDRLMAKAKRDFPNASCAPTKLSEVEILTALSKLLDQQLYKDVSGLKELSARKDAFVANVSHEFKSPLSILHSYCETILDGALGSINSNLEDAVRSCDKVVMRLNRLVSDLLDLAKIQAGAMSLNKLPVDLKTVLSDLENEFSLILAEAKISLNKEFDSQACVVLGDADRLHQVFINLFSNCLKYSPRPGTIHLRLKVVDSNFLTIEIKDEGPGMDPQNLVKIFDKFERIGEDKREGTGLGLPIAKEIVELHGGKIWVESAIGQGSKFCVDLNRHLES